ncbi:hypothetical protein CFC21_056792 [Triticum aestivum]|uniref:COBRA-like protein n=3 Tax=Triticum TaxID=4564 RepID=A0A9R0WA95_TRITD|nr:COBRA-like protein 2 [Triticum aestivum]KAF7047959.1 hypothetical protein CFC21_056792 [Triticum aestivum]VAI02702.1 unnamed protein product [Triticum turgidum subsp. durum]
MRLCAAAAALALLLLVGAAPLTEAYDPLDPTGNITIKWDITQWTADGYIAVVSINNYQKYRHIQAPGWHLRWAWTKKEIIWGMMGAQTIEQGDCSEFKGNIPHCCRRDPTVVDLLPGATNGMQVGNCCKGGVLSSWVQDPVNAVASFQITVGRSGTSNRTVKPPKNFTLKAPGPGYTCGATHKVKPPTKFISPDGRRTTQAQVTWDVICTYSQFVAQRGPACCVALSSFYNETIVDCPKCSCGCQNNITNPGSCVEANSPYLASVVNGPGKGSSTPLVRCSPHMCPIKVHWHVKANYREYWRVKITISNWNYRMNYSQWNLVVQHPNFDNVTTIFSFNYKALNPYGVINDTAMLWGLKYYNDLLMVSGPDGNVQSELLFRKDPSTFTFEKGWGFPRRIYFNGQSCVMPQPDLYPWLPSSSPRLTKTAFLALAIAACATVAFLYNHLVLDKYCRKS